MLGTSRLLSRWRSVAGPAEIASCVICQGCYGVGGCSTPACLPEGGMQALLGSAVAEDDVIRWRSGIV